MKRQIDLLLGSIMLAAPVVLNVPVQSTSLQFAGGPPPAFSESYLLSSASFPAVPDPDTFRQMDRLGIIVMGQYTVRPSDTLASIAQRFGTTSEHLRSTNQLRSIYLSPGRKITVHNGKGMLHQVREVKGRPETLQEISRRYGVTPEAIAKANRLPGAALLSSDWLEAGSPLFIPGAQLRFTDYLLPVDWSRGMRMFSSNFGYRRHPILRYRKFHTGLDLPRPSGSPVKASRDGVVIFADWRGGYGKLIIVKHVGGMRTWYGHLSGINVTPGQRVRAGQLIGKVGSTGLSTGPHLHFEVRDRYGRALNPKKFLF
jgi:murein DD-endopeptidase MepM/ murein hydrolase activator NlpD